ncbi:FAS1 domain-containing protein [Rickenella mellea]|uniref:FAS1 domain-containing protein n=1 Tax=Rickenella mellea TaxID=50990 RepID=A0A4Y7Q1M0_9AGAM|nr:FAS1 domain-containing protein [Rickenella mellea]
MFSLLPIAALVAPALAQQNITYLTSLLGALNSAGLTSLATAAGQINSTATGQNVLEQLSKQTPFTVFAPNNNAFKGVPSNISSNVQLVSDIIAYHVLPGTFSTAATAPNTTVARTLLNDSSVTFLEGNKNQVVAWQNSTSGKVTILNQNTPVTVLNSTQVGNLTVLVVDGVIDLPGSLEAALTANNLTGLKTVLQTTGLLNPLSTIHGFTLFAPSDEALAAAQSQLTTLGSNATLITNLVDNHVINGSSVYSPEIAAAKGNFTSGAGEGISAVTNSSGTFLTSGNTTAKVTKPDIILYNGVVHIIDHVFLNTDSNAGAASSAFQSATSAAAQPSAATGAVGSPTGSGAGASGTAKSGASGLRVQAGAGAMALVASVFFAL